ncbi:hypothetical protein PG985_001044 [Apiospora marii]|uniref:Uncharacterized protein n=1 Tax=Apiospora marii TaxID=335849 RepID=A0ABR1RI00_9PEZI
MASRRSAAGKERQRSAVDNDSSSRLPPVSAFAAAAAAAAADIRSRPPQTPYSNVRSSVLASTPVPAATTTPTSASPSSIITNTTPTSFAPSLHHHLPRSLRDFVEPDPN